MANDLVNKIKIETAFADAIYRDFKSDRFGISKCCYQDTQSVTIKKYLCDWQDLKSEELTHTEDVNAKVVCNDTTT
jgi:hypothetical protein|tara:strand:- start:293 stop:520 length:228 start_codon:yes stop_codon:yes gene_type:complete